MQVLSDLDQVGRRGGAANTGTGEVLEGDENAVDAGKLGLDGVVSGEVEFDDGVVDCTAGSDVGVQVLEGVKVQRLNMQRGVK